MKTKPMLRDLVWLKSELKASEVVRALKKCYNSEEFRVEYCVGQFMVAGYVPRSVATLSELRNHAEQLSK